MRCILLLGLPRTGSSSVQRILRTISKSSIEAAPFIPDDNDPSDGIFGLHGHAAIFEEVLSGRNDWGGLLLEVGKAAGRDLVVSFEMGFLLLDPTFQHYNPTFVRDLKTDLRNEGYDLEVHLVVRDYVDWIASIYAQEVASNFEVKSLQEYVNGFSGRPGAVASSWLNELGQSSLQVHSFARLISDPIKWIMSDVCRSKIDLDALKWLKRPSENRSLRAWEIDLCRLWNNAELVSNRARPGVVTLGDVLRKFHAEGDEFLLDPLSMQLIIQNMSADHTRLLENFPDCAVNMVSSEMESRIGGFERMDTIHQQERHPPGTLSALDLSDRNMLTASLALQILGHW